MSARQAQSPWPVVEVYLVRHGETEENVRGIIQGTLDTELNEVGAMQSDVTGDFFVQEGITFEQAYTSDLQRASKTAEIILGKQANPAPLVPDPRIRERHLGKIQGGRKPKVYDDKEMGCELYPQLGARLCDFWDAVFPADRRTPSILPPALLDPSRAPSDWPAVLLVSHGASLSTLIEGVILHPNMGVELTDPAAKERPKRRRFANCSITKILMWDTGRDGKRRRWRGRVEVLCSDRHLWHLYEEWEPVRDVADDLSQPTVEEEQEA